MTGLCARLFVVACVAGCSPADQPRVVARVNGEAILAQEVDLALQYRGVAEHDLNARQRLLEKIMIEELLAQQFLRSTPGSASVNESAMIAARRGILARRYIDELVGGIARPRPEQITAFYRENPALFAQRRIFTMRQIDVSVPPSREAELRERVRSAASLDEFAEWLRQENLQFVRTESEHSSDELPRTALKQIDRMSKGNVGVLATDTGLRVIQVLRARSEPLDEKTAWPLIERRLWTEMRATAVEAEVRRLSRIAAISIPGSAPRGPIQALIGDRDAATPPVSSSVPSTRVNAPGG
jgi:EpsD family peptidyl-prolyl cis-trans isomerase